MSTPAFIRRVPAGIAGMSPYQPGMPVEELQRRLGLGDVVKLASNENPLGCSPRAHAVLESWPESLALYPDGGGFALKARLAEYHGLPAEQITLGNGSNDLLEFVARIFLGPDRAAMYSAHAFAVYPLAAAAQNAPSVVVPARPADAEDAYGHDLDAFARMLTPQVAVPRVSVIFIANPNNPTGTALSADAVEQFLAQVPEDVVVVLDQAYWHYQPESQRPDCNALLARYPNLLITRTFSKVYGLAALRLGYGLSHPALADLLNRVRQPFNNNSLALAAGVAALDDAEFVAQSVALNAEQLAALSSELAARGLRVLPSFANFVAVDFGRDAQPIHQSLLEQGVIVRPMGSYDMPTFLRVTVGTHDENQRFLTALDRALSQDA